jgi:hypothetical protein
VASSSRRDVCKGALALAALAASGANCARRSSSQLGPWLRVEAAADLEPEGAIAWRGLALALRALPEARRTELVEDVSQWVADAEARSNPFVVDLSDESTPPLERVRSWFLPIWNAATALDARRWRLPRENLDVAIVRDELAGSGPRVFRAWQGEGDSQIERARFAAWAVARARLVDCGSTEGRDRLAARLGDRLGDPDSCIGLFVDSRHLDRADRCRPFDSILEMAERSRRLAARAQPGSLDPELKSLLAHVPPGEPISTVKDWLDLGANEVLVVPRLGALARVAAYEGELKGLRAAAGL